MNKAYKNITQIVESYVGWLNEKGLDLNDVMPVGYALDDNRVIDHVLDVVKNNSSVSFDMGDKNVRNIVVEVLTANNFMGDGLYETIGRRTLTERSLPSSVNLLLESLGEDPYDGPYPETAAEYANQLNSTRQPGDFLRLATDQAHWDEMGVFSGEDLVRYLISADYVDSYKEMYGFKPRLNWEGLTIDQMRQKLDELLSNYQADDNDHSDGLDTVEPIDSSVNVVNQDIEPSYDEYEDDRPNWQPISRYTNESQLRKMIREELLRELAYKTWET
jgi:hypothetical protein